MIQLCHQICEMSVYLDCIIIIIHVFHFLKNAIFHCLYIYFVSPSNPLFVLVCFEIFFVLFLFIFIFLNSFKIYIVLFINGFSAVYLLCFPSFSFFLFFVLLSFVFKKFFVYFLIYFMLLLYWILLFIYFDSLSLSISYFPPSFLHAKI